MFEAGRDLQPVEFDGDNGMVEPCEVSWIDEHEEIEILSFSESF